MERRRTFRKLIYMKLKIALLVVSLAVSTSFFAQGKYSTKSGEITFEASVPSFEEVKAKNNNVSAILNAETGEFAALSLLKGFRFKVALMEEHFNENYIESSIYPKATFKGKIKDFYFSELSEKKKEVLIIGTINLHGKDKAIEVPAFVSMIDGSIAIDMSFVLKPSEFNIKIPNIVSSKIAEEVNVSAMYLLKK